MQVYKVFTTILCYRIAVSLLASLVALTGGSTHFVSAQTFLSSREPVVSGTVIDVAPFNWVAAGDLLESGMIVGQNSSEIRKPVLEFDISDLVPGVMDTARIRGTVLPVDLEPTGERLVEFGVSIGDGMVDLNDNINGHSILGFVRHDPGSTTPYDRNLTGSLREFVLDNPDYLNQRVTPAGMSQGFDAISNATLELELRPTDPSTIVYYEAPTARAAANAQNSGPYSLDQSAAFMEVMDFEYAPFRQGRGLMEYDLSSIPANAIVQWAKIDVGINGFQGTSQGGPNFEIVGYHADGNVTLADISDPGIWVGMSGDLQSDGETNESWDINPDFVSSVLQAGGYLGLRIQPGERPELQGRIRLNSESRPSSEPRLAIAYTIPELAGDFDSDGDVDGADFLAWQRDTSIGDLTDWQFNYDGGVSPLATAVQVPEPSTLALIFFYGLSGNSLIRRQVGSIGRFCSS